MIPSLVLLIGLLLAILLIFASRTDFLPFSWSPSTFAAGLGLLTSVVATFLFEFVRSRTSSSEQPVTRPEDVDTAQPNQPVKVLDNSASLDLMDIIANTRQRLLFFTVSGRNIIMNPQIVHEFGRVIKERRRISIRFLCVNQYADNDYPAQRKRMMNTPGRFNPYETDFNRAREVTRQITNLDPAHTTFDIRFYDMLPTTFFIISDNKLYVSFLMSKPVAECPLVEIDGAVHPTILKVFEDHFDFYWSQSRSFVCVIGFSDAGEFVMIRHWKRGWEWPAGYIEPNEKPEESASREFTEETGFSISNLRLIRQTPSGLYFSGLVGPKIGTPSPREVSGVKFFKTLPDRRELSFGEERELFEHILQDCPK